MSDADFIETIIAPNLDSGFDRWFFDGAVVLAGNPKTCAELKNIEHFWIGASETCACGKMVWHKGDQHPVDAAF